jgi:iron complex outermembrane receptor protein
LRYTPSLVATSDAGTGIGYTGLWIRGSDPSRINVTVNDIPINDPESQQVFWVNMPDFGSSADGIQVQRGVGTSTNGAASLGGTIKLGTTNIKPKAYAELNNTYGSFNTIKNTVMAGTGLIDERYTVDMRLSNISSDGFVDRASARMKSFYASGARYGESSVLLVVMKGLTNHGMVCLFPDCWAIATP